MSCCSGIHIMHSKQVVNFRWVYIKSVPIMASWPIGFTELGVSCFKYFSCGGRGVQARVPCLLVRFCCNERWTRGRQAQMLHLSTSLKGSLMSATRHFAWPAQRDPNHPLVTLCPLAPEQEQKPIGSEELSTQLGKLGQASSDCLL